MNFKTLNHIKSLFWEITSFYITWNREPTFILDKLESHPNIVRLKEIIDRKINDQQRSDLTGKLPLPKPYKLSGKDVDRYLYFDYVLLLGKDYFTLLVDELISINTEAEVGTRIDWCNQFNHILNTLLQEIQIFNNAPSDKIEISDDIVDWSSMIITVNSLANDHILPLIEQYRKAIKKYIPDVPIYNNKSNSNTVDIHIKPKAKQKLIDELIVFVPDPTHQASLKALINDNTTPSSCIVCHCKKVSIAFVFYKRVRSEKTYEREIETDKTKLASWICQNFKVFRNGKIEKLSEATLCKALSGIGLAKRV